MRLASVDGRARHLAGWHRDHPDHRDLVFASAIPPSARPSSHDLRDRCPPVRDQGALGTCVTFATLSALGYLYTRAGQADPQFSHLALYYWTRRYEGTPATEDSGLQIRDAFKILRRYGAAPESLWPYSDDGHAFTREPPEDVAAAAIEHQAELYYRCANLGSVLASIAQGFPVVGGFSVPESMMSDNCARTGDVQYPAPREAFVGGHAVMLVGYDEATQRIAFQNSWGPGWGRRGYGTLPYQFVIDGLADDFRTLRSAEEAP
jgi:C1A family cysteine protease